MDLAVYANGIGHHKIGPEEATHLYVYKLPILRQAEKKTNYVIVWKMMHDAFWDQWNSNVVLGGV